MKNQEILLARHGLMKKDLAGKKETFGAKLLSETLNLMVKYGQSLDTLPEKEFITLLKEASRIVDGPGREMLINPLFSDLPLTMMDSYIRGMVRWMNELGIYSICSCDGHGHGRARIDLLKHLSFSQMKLLKTAAPEGIQLKIERKSVFLYYKRIGSLLDYAENLYRVFKSPEYLKDLEAVHFKHRVIELLNIPGISQDERKIRLYLKNRLSPLTDYMYVDRKGNLLAYKYCGDGPTILLSAHMDTVEEIALDRDILEEGTILKSSKGILGADDRAGIAVILELLANIQQTHFNGTIKIAFTVEEEIGCLGSQNIDQDFLEDVDGAIVIDRRGERDIVTSFANIVSFCPVEYGQLFEKAGKLAGMEDWKMTPGGLSDAKVYAELGIPSVNLSAGYYHEHTDLESLNYKAAFETYQLVMSVLHNQLIKRVEMPLFKN
ncbi:M20/M25/M40 family metallo-hydrolase [Paenibacillus sp. BSR1-1]|uniref:M20/M25/M40 family metallo-hydrolase n=1 Tax=Paenibacillus sp. BSR1-1 TaxID=3020845 RepID=UPI0025B00679|nr:M20/M25/M40 family metallo-hydrolase [Paenibacillus sp. BSR1-1]MDN3016072.1 M20/M25/M40 family metallo-hydrolase [Paenibacillus sp. BSR1-1]